MAKKESNSRPEGIKKPPPPPPPPMRLKNAFGIIINQEEIDEWRKRHGKT